MGAGEAGCRVASQYFATHPNPAVGDRVLLLNSAESDISTLHEVLEADLRGEQGKERLDIVMRQSHPFGDASGTGNNPLKGEQYLDEGWDEVSRFIEGSLGGSADVMVHVLGVGGGTGCGSVPPMIYKLRHGQAKAVSKDVYQFAMAMWPAKYEGEQRLTNAALGLSRLLRFGPRDELNANFVLLLGNHELEALARKKDIQRGGNFREMNKIAVETLNALISPGQKSSEIIDASDYARESVFHEILHFTAGVAWEVPSIINLDQGINEALESMLLPIDPKTSLAAYLIVQVPPDEYDAPEFSSAEVGSTFEAWLSTNGFDIPVRYNSVVPNPSLRGTYHVILVLGGFNLEPLIKPVEPLMKKEIRRLKKAFRSDDDTSTRYEKIWKNLLEYSEASNAKK
ncbi:MAG: hypothetical protein HY556_04885 [Euryarchaeota archaeon]|nr:hypothetical protein [Euryarchaeota archaeon]